jgi:hypothetical protein
MIADRQILPISPAIFADPFRDSAPLVWFILGKQKKSRKINML